MSAKPDKGYGFGTFQGVFTPSILTIIGVVMYLRFGWVLGSVGLVPTLVIVTLSSAITFLTGLSISALATNMKMGGGGAYYMISRSFGVEVGAAAGLPLYLSQAIGIAFYVVGFTEAFVHAVPAVAGWDPRLVGLATLGGMALMATLSASVALKSQYLVMAAIVLSLVSFFLGSSPSEGVDPASVTAESPGFWHVLAVFFPAVTGILSGVGMSGDLKDPAKSIPRGTIAAVLTGWAVYMAVPIALHLLVSDRATLLTDPLVMQKCARIPWLILAGVWAASLSSALGGLLAAPRTLQALARDRVVPRFLGKGFGESDDPRRASALTFLIAAAGVWLGDINALAPVLTIFNLTAYALLNLSSGLEETLASPAWRPAFRVRAPLSFLGFAGCAGMMFMISPGATIIAAAVTFVIWWLMTKREMSARWGDMRTGLHVFLAHIALRGLARSRADDTHGWRPNLLVLSGAPERRPRVVELASTLAGRQGLATYAAVVADEAWRGGKAAELADSMRQHLARRGIDGQVRVQPGQSAWEGIRELVRTYGYGPLEPNTVLLGGVPGEDFASLLLLAAERMKNAVVLRSDSGALFPDDRPARIDVWWRGKSENASFMLAMAVLLQRSRPGRRAAIRLCHLASPDGVSAAEARNRLVRFLAESRVRAEAVVVEGGGDPFERIAEASAGSSVVLLGLRPNREGETAASYAEYFDAVLAGTAALPQAIFVRVAERLPFKDIFRSP